MNLNCQKLVLLLILGSLSLEVGVPNRAKGFGDLRMMDQILNAPPDQFMTVTEPSEMKMNERVSHLAFEPKLVDREIDIFEHSSGPVKPPVVSQQELFLQKAAQDFERQRTAALESERQRRASQVLNKINAVDAKQQSGSLHASFSQASTDTASERRENRQMKSVERQRLTEPNEQRMESEVDKTQTSPDSRLRNGESSYQTLTPQSNPVSIPQSKLTGPSRLNSNSFQRTTSLSQPTVDAPQGHPDGSLQKDNLANDSLQNQLNRSAESIKASSDLLLNSHTLNDQTTAPTTEPQTNGRVHSLPNVPNRQLGNPDSGPTLEFKSRWSVPGLSGDESDSLTVAHSSLHNSSDQTEDFHSTRSNQSALDMNRSQTVSDQFANTDAYRINPNQPPNEPVHKETTPLDTLARLKQIYSQEFEAYKVQIEELEAARKSYEDARQLREVAEHEYEVQRNALQAEAMEQSQDTIVAKLDASQLLKSKQHVGDQIKELGQLDAELTEQIEALNKKHEYLAQQFDDLNQKKQELTSKGQLMEERKKKVECSDAEFASKLENLHAELSKLARDNEQLELKKTELDRNSSVIQSEIAKLKQRAKKRRILKRRIQSRKLRPELKKSEMENIKRSYTESFQTLMTRVTELEVIKKQNNQNLMSLDALKEDFDSEQSRLNEKIILLKKKEEVLRNKERDYQFKEQTCGCQRVQVLPEASARLQSRIRRLSVAKRWSPTRALVMPHQVPLASPPMPVFGQTMY